MTHSPPSTALRWYQALEQAQAALAPHALATVVTVAGSAPRGAGTKMLITPAALHDSLGGGRLEQLVAIRARALLSAGHSGCHLEEVALGAHAQQCCGGHVQVLIEVFPAVAPRLALFGAGHVGQAIVALLAPLGWQIDWLDSREQQLASAHRPRGCEPHLHCSTFNILMRDDAVHPLPVAADSHVLELTHDHVEDQALVAALAVRSDLASLGLIGSSSKWARFHQRLRAHLAANELARIRCPIGVPGIPGKRPEEIAIGVVAELLQLEALRHASISESSRADPTAASTLDQCGLSRKEARQLRTHFTAPDYRQSSSAVTSDSTTDRTAS
ncbi:MAG: xanthine dehydrogenase accessory protein XdhC [Cobetia crustatorum]